MKIFFNARLFQHRITGVQRYAIELLKTLDLLIDRGEIGLGDSSLIMLAPAKVKSSLCFKHLQFRQVGLLHGHLWEQIELPFYARNGLLVNLCNTAPLFKRDQIVTIHDAAVFANPKTYSFLFLLWYKMLLRRIGQMSKRIITVSAFSKKELHRYCHIPLAKMQVIYEGSEHLCSQSTDDTILRKHNLKPNSYLLAVSSIKKNKNFDSLMKAFDFLPDHELEIVIAGARDCKIYDNKYMALPKNIKYVGYVCDSELRALYENAAFFVYPSFYEGFGLPPIEA
ncbi:MAG: glycosyltransferase family 4 protein, partial [Thermodesulfobacteriota bacterium]